MMDKSETVKHTMNSDMRKKYRKCGRRRLRLDQKYNYESNIFSRNHGPSFNKHLDYLMIRRRHQCYLSSNYTPIKGIGKYMMNSIISLKISRI